MMHEGASKPKPKSYSEHMSSISGVYAEHRKKPVEGLQAGHGLGGGHSIDGRHEMGSMTSVESSRIDPLKQALTASGEKSFSKHQQKVGEAYGKYSADDIREMIRAKVRSEGRDASDEADEPEVVRPTHLYDDSTSDVQKMIAAKKRMEAEDGSERSEENSD